MCKAPALFLLFLTIIYLAWFSVVRAGQERIIPSNPVASAPAFSLPSASSHPPTINPYTNEYVAPIASTAQPGWWQQYQHYFGLAAIGAGTSLAAIAVVIMRRQETNSKRKT